MIKRSIGAAAAFLCLTAVAGAQEPVRANFIGLDGKEVGRASLYAVPKGVFIELEMGGMPANQWLAFHVHQNGSCDAKDQFKSAGDHFNPGDHQHGLMGADGPHAGDMPNIPVDAEGKARAQVLNTMVKLEGENAIRGKALVVHAKADDNRSQPAGGAGDRIACAVIE